MAIPSTNVTMTSLNTELGYGTSLGLYRNNDYRVGGANQTAPATNLNMGLFRGAVEPVYLTFNGRTFTGTGAFHESGSRSWGGVSFGAAGNSVVVVSFMVNDGSTFPQANSCTIGGVSCTKIGACYSTANDNRSGITIFLGTCNASSGTVSVNYNSTMLHSGVAVFNATGACQASSTYFPNNKNTGSITVPSNGFGIYASMTQNGSGTNSVPNFNNDSTFDFGTSEWASVGDTTATGSISVQASGSANTGSYPIHAAVGFGPA